jgi:hypothetical protein
MFPIASHAQVICISNASPPAELPFYEQPPIPEPGYMWTPGYWAGGPYGYFWVPGTWVQPPASAYSLEANVAAKSGDYRPSRSTTAVAG